MRGKYKLSDYFSDYEQYGEIYFDQLSVVDTLIKNSLVYVEKSRYLDIAETNKNISGIIIHKELFSKCKTKNGVVISNHPKFDFWNLHNLMLKKGLLKLRFEAGVGENCNIHPSAIVSGISKLGNNVKVGEGAVIKEYSIIGDNSLIASGVIIGSDGLQTCTKYNKKIFVSHAGGVRIGQNVHILANSVVARAVELSYTEIGSNTMIGPLCGIGHSSEIGDNCDIAGNTLIGGSVILGNNVWIGPSSTIKDGVNVGENAKIKLGSVVVKDVESGEVVSGNFAYNHKKRLRSHVGKSG